MVERGLDREYELLTLFKSSVTERRSIADRVRLPWLLARADVIVIDDYQPVIYRVDDPDVRIIQLWHAWGAFKTVGYSRIGKPGGPSPYSRVHKNYTHAIVSSDAEVPFYAEAFGIPEARVAPTGIPRMDRFFDPARGGGPGGGVRGAFPGARSHRDPVRPDVPAPARKEPTPRQLLDYAKLHALCVEKDAVCVIRLHPFVRIRSTSQALSDRRWLVAGVDVNDLLSRSTCSSPTTRHRVRVLDTGPPDAFAYDLGTWRAATSTWITARSSYRRPDVRRMLTIRRRLSRKPAFRAAHLDHFDGHATDRVIDLILDT
jgi:hypothetical protein